MPMKHIIHCNPFYHRLQRSRFMGTNLCFDIPWPIGCWMLQRCSEAKPYNVTTTIVITPMFYFFFFPLFFLPLSPFLPPFLPLPCFIIRLNKEIPRIGEIYLIFLIITNWFKTILRNMTKIHGCFELLCVIKLIWWHQVFFNNKSLDVLPLS